MIYSDTPARGGDAEGAGNGWQQRRGGTAVATPVTPPRGIERERPVDVSIERGYVASLRWLVSEGDARGLVRIAVEIAALREALATLDETRNERDDRARRLGDLGRDVQHLLQSVTDGTPAGSPGDRLRALRERVVATQQERQRLHVELEAWRGMCGLLTRTRAKVHELLETSERDRERLLVESAALRTRVKELEATVERLSRESSESRADATALRSGLQKWSGTVERALAELARQASQLGAVAAARPPGGADASS
jgi:DNA repair exonuclease SbcCD ATPase subunit